MPYPDYMDLVRYHSDPEKYMKPPLTSTDIEDKKARMMGSLEKLRSEKKD